MDWIVARSTLVLLTAFSCHVSLSPPNRPSVPPSQEPKETTGASLSVAITENCSILFEKFVQNIVLCSKSIVWLGAIIDILVMHVAFLLSHTRILQDNAIQHVICPIDGKFPISTLWSIHPIMIIGVLMALLGALLRFWCFKTLGPLFTFEVLIQPRHTLITSGPYSYVRHPSYTGIYLTLSGATVTLCAPNSYFTYCGVMSISGVRRAICLFVLGIWVFKCIWACVGMSKRLHAEDKVLKQTFGETWDAYHARVPFGFIPGII
ncbi:Isoprenylcysteine carboxyl methyltransferase family-domain-containing protein [Infundibulicybe gibba]|nr:Isoprenylcysteine carboxyl methyltransferase family-domain-containing protein [Infundibulicybe gibba]